MQIPQSLKFQADGLLPAIIQDDASGQVLMLGYMNQEALERTIGSGRVTFWSRSRKQFWIKGETSGHIQTVREITVDCDCDCILVKVDQEGAACHEGYRSCFFRRIEDQGDVLETIAQPLVDPY